MLHSHVELLGIELQEQKARTVSLLLFAGLALVFGLLLLLGLSALVLIVLWDSYRLPGIIGLCIFYTLARSVLRHFRQAHGNKRSRSLASSSSVALKGEDSSNTVALRRKPQNAAARV